MVGSVQQLCSRAQGIAVLIDPWQISCLLRLVTDRLMAVLLPNDSGRACIIFHLMAVSLWQGRRQGPSPDRDYRQGPGSALKLHPLLRTRALSAQMQLPICVHVIAVLCLMTALASSLPTSGCKKTTPVCSMMHIEPCTCMPVSVSACLQVNA